MTLYKAGYKAGIGVLLLFAAAGCAHIAPADAAVPGCPIPNVSLAEAYSALPGAVQVTTASRVDADSSEPILRHVVDYADGTLAVVEQQNCVIANLRVTRLAPDAAMDDRAIRRVVDLVEASPLWQAHFIGQNLAAAMRAAINRRQAAGSDAGAFTVALDLPPASGGVSDANLALVNIPGHDAPFDGQLSVTFSVGD